MQITGMSLKSRNTLLRGNPENRLLGRLSALLTSRLMWFPENTHHFLKGADGVKGDGGMFAFGLSVRPTRTQLSSVDICCSIHWFEQRRATALQRLQIGSFVIWRIGLPTAIDYPDPLESQCSYCGLVATTFCALLAVIGTRPIRLVDGLCRPFNKSLA